MLLEKPKKWDLQFMAQYDKMKEKEEKGRML